jgi:hypothetical protein
MSEIDDLRNRVAELEELCGIAVPQLSNPFSGYKRRRLLVIAGLLVKRTVVGVDAIVLAFGGDTVSRLVVENYIHCLRQQLRGMGIVLRNERAIGWYLSNADRCALKRIITGATS